VCAWCSHKIAAERLAKYVSVKCFVIEHFCKKLQEVMKESSLKFSQFYSADETGLL